MFKLVNVLGWEHVVTEQKHHRTLPYNDANYMNTGMCLCGILNKGETIEDWEKRTKKNNVKLKKRKNDSRSKTRRND